MALISLPTRAAGACTLVDRSGAAERVEAVELPNGPGRDAVIAATTHLPAPTGRIYRAAGDHIRAVGRYFEPYLNRTLARWTVPSTSVTMSWRQVPDQLFDVAHE